MVRTSTKKWEWLEQWTGTLFLVAGGLMVVHTGVHGLIAFTDITYPLHHELPFGVVGHVLAFLALLGLYPQLVARSPTLAHAGAILAVIGTVGWVIIGITALSETLEVTLPEWIGIFGLVTIVVFILGYLVFSIASFSTGIVSRTTAIIILTPALVMVYNMTVALTTGGTQEGQIIVAGGFALTHLAIGAALRSEAFPTGEAEPTASVAT